MSQKTTGRNTELSPKIVEYLAEKGGYKLCDFSTIAKYELAEDGSNRDAYNEAVRKRIRGHQFEDELPRTGRIYVQPATLKQQNCRVKHGVYWDDKNLIAYGIPNGFDPITKEIRWKNINIEISREFDLSHPRDYEDFYVLIHSPHVRDSIFDPFGKGALKVVDQEREAREEIKRIRDSAKAIDIVEAIPDNEIADFGVLFGMPAEQSANMTRAGLMKEARTSPSELVKKWKDEDRKLVSILKSAMSYGIVGDRFGEGIMKGEFKLGDRVADAVEYLKTAPDMLSDLERAVRNARVGGEEQVVHRPNKPQKSRTL